MDSGEQIKKSSNKIHRIMREGSAIGGSCIREWDRLEGVDPRIKCRVICEISRLESKGGHGAGVLARARHGTTIKWSFAYKRDDGVVGTGTQ